VRACKRTKKLTLLAITLLLFDISIIAYGASLLWDAPTHGRIIAEGVEVWEDREGTIPALRIDWGDAGPGDNVTRVLYVQNVGNYPSNITLWTTNWCCPEADQYLSLTWNYTGALIPVMGIIPVELKLMVHPDIAGVTTFSFDVGITIMAFPPEEV